MSPCADSTELSPYLPSHNGNLRATIAIFSRLSAARTADPSEERPARYHCTFSEAGDLLTLALMRINSSCTNRREFGLSLLHLLARFICGVLCSDANLDVRVTNAVSKVLFRFFRHSCIVVMPDLVHGTWRRFLIKEVMSARSCAQR